MFSYKLFDRLIFYFLYIYYHFRIFFDVKTGLISVLLAELFWLILVVLKKRYTVPELKDYYETIKGKFHVNPDLQSVITVSPAFERMDYEYLAGLIRSDLNKKKKVLFIDVGAHVGVYTVGFGNLFRKYSNFQVICFEPNATNFAGNNYQLLMKNIKLNKINNVKVYKVGLGSKTTKQVNKFGIKTERLDMVLGQKFAEKFDSVYIKIDIEGYEKDALQGAVGFIEKCKKLTLLIEDCINPNIRDYLNDKFIFLKKISSYNSFWVKP